MPMYGDFGKVDEWIRRFDELASDRSRTRVAEEMAEKALELTAQDFTEERGPFGGAWAAKKRDDGRPIGQGRTGKLAKYRIKSVNGIHFRIGSDAPYAGYFNNGTKFMRKRQIVPNNGRMPREWSAAFKRIWSAHCRLVLGGGR